jgi:hypothetical protein
MEQAILKTLAYYDVFGFPLKAWEVHKWLAGKEATLVQTEKALQRLEKKLRAGSYKGYWFLPGKKSLVGSRVKRESVSAAHLRTARRIGFLLRVVPWIKMVGISGSLAMSSSREGDDIDLFVVTESRRVWLSRIFIILLTSLTGLRRSRREKKLSAAGKICINLILETSNLGQKKKNIYVAHEVLQMRPVWQRGEVYSDFLHANSWAFRYLPNWRSSFKMDTTKWNFLKKTPKIPPFSLMDRLEIFAKSFQLKIMKRPSGAERIESGALYFHPEDKGVKIVKEYKSRISDY